MKSPLVVGLAVLMSACATQAPKERSVQQRIDETLKQAQTAPKAPEAVAVPPSVSQSLLPSMRETLPRVASPQAAEPRFDLVMTNAPIAQVLHAIVADTRYSILLSPRVATP